MSFFSTWINFNFLISLVWKFEDIVLSMMNGDNIAHGASSIDSNTVYSENV